MNLDLILPNDPSPPIFFSLAKIVLVGEVGKIILVVDPLFPTLEARISSRDGLSPLCGSLDLYSRRHSGDRSLFGVNCNGGFGGLFLAGDTLAGGFDRPLGYLIEGEVPNLLNTFPCTCVGGERDNVLVLLTSRKQCFESFGAISIGFASFLSMFIEVFLIVYLLIFRSC